MVSLTAKPVCCSAQSDAPSRVCRATAIQLATRTTVESNSAIRDTVAEVQATATRICAAIGVQSAPVTTIIAAVDETAQAASAMSETIAGIRSDSERVTDEMNSLGSSFELVNSKLADLQAAASEYVKLSRRAR